jgi:ribosomal peptide maturation radical SAM protein 1
VTGEPKLLLVCPPFASVYWGSLGLATLKAVCAEAGIAADVLYLNIPFARQIGVERYQRIGQLFDAEIVFTSALFPDVTAAGVWERYVALRGRGAGAADDLASSRGSFLHLAGELAPRLVAQTLRETAWDDYDIVGFTTGFHQTVSTLALAAAVRRRFPDKVLLAGGAGCDGDMGPALLRQFDTLDLVVAGEADTLMVPLIESLRRGEPVDRWPGVFARPGPRVNVDPAGSCFADGIHGRPWSEADARFKVRLDELPVPDFSDFFEQVGVLDAGERLRLPFESSRGCWWGQKSLCTFCGLNGTSLAYRAKSPRRVLDEIDSQYARYGVRRFMAVDNILDMGFLTSLLPGLEERHRGLGLELFYETKSNLRGEQVRRLRRAGVTEVQPGIESFSDHVLELMSKGTTGYNQVRFLRDCDGAGLVPRYGILWANPGETAEDYATLRRLLPSIRHLTPPRYVQPIALERFSPYFLDPGRFGIRHVRAAEIYRVAFGGRDLDYDSLAYIFSYEHDFDHDPALHRERDRYLTEVEAWQAKHRPGTLLMADLDGELLVADRRDGEDAVLRLDGAARRLLLACLDARTEAWLRPRTGLAADDLAAALTEMADAGLLLAWPSRPPRYLALPVPVEPAVFHRDVLVPAARRVRSA